MKKYLKKNLISFVIGLILFGSIGVYAVVTFQSNKIAYNNKTSGLSSNNVQGAIDELYEQCTKVPTPGETILDNEEIVSSGDGLYKDEYEDRYFYKGKNVNNYITFNNETWRIISIENDGTIKIIKSENFKNHNWDDTNSNNWNKPATLNTYLNNTYYNSLNEIAKSQLISGEFNIGKITENNDDLKSQINDEGIIKWKGNIALITVSEYLRSNSNSYCSSLKQNNNNYTTCHQTNWMSDLNGLLLTVSASTNANNNRIFMINCADSAKGNISTTMSSITTSYAVNPVLYLSSDVKITGGDGTSSNPYTLG